MISLKSYHHPYLFMMIENRSRHTENLEKVDSCINAKFKITSNLKKVKFHPIWFWRPLLNYSITIMFILEVQVNKTIKSLTISSSNITLDAIAIFYFNQGLQCLLGYFLYCWTAINGTKIILSIDLRWYERVINVNMIHIIFCVISRFRDLSHPLLLKQIWTIYYDPRKMRGFWGMVFGNEHSEIWSKMVCALGHVMQPKC